jgi:NAD(P)-dependent dehydrogenase (short-subunit alcohol dehydrogenase family)
MTSVGDVDLRGQVALVTGGGRGIGRATAVALARAGASVAIAARSEDQLRDTARAIESTGGRALPLTVDVTDQPAVESLVDTVEESLGPIDLLVNNAGLIGDYGPTWEADPALWWRVMEVNVLGPFLCARSVLARMVARRRGRVVNLSSSVAIGRFPHGAAYAVSKAAITRFTENLAGEVNEHGIAVFAVSPGTVLTEMTRHVLDSPSGQKWQPQLRQLFAEGRDVPPERAAHLIVYLASGRADVLTGRYVSVGDDVPDLVRRAAEIAGKDLYTMRLRTQGS